MLALDHLRLPVTDLTRALWFRVDDVDATHATWSARGVVFAHGPWKTSWGYGAELRDPDGYLVRRGDERSMRER